MLRWPKIEAGAHVRTCQECGHAQKAKDPATTKGDGWRDLKCRRCKSESMDFGSKNAEVVEEEEDEPNAPLCRCPPGTCILHPTLKTCGMREREV